METDINMRLAKAWTAINWLSVIWKSDLTNKIKHCFLQASVVSILLYRCTTWRLTKRMEKKLNSNYARMLLATSNKSWKQHPTKEQLYSHLPPITKTIKVRCTRHMGYCWTSKDRSDVLMWTTSVGGPARTYIQQLCAGTGCSLEDLPGAMDERDEWQERVREIHASSATWGWWWDVIIYHP